METIMLARTLRTGALALILAALAATAPIHAGTEMRTQYLTFGQPVMLPGVALRAGTYIFEMPSPSASPDIVRVMSRDRKTVYFTAFTRSVDRPSEMPVTQLISTREVAKGQPAPIAVWWSDARTGRQFIYEQ
jgi:hypothetical protein